MKSITCQASACRCTASRRHGGARRAERSRPGPFDPMVEIVDCVAADFQLRQPQQRRQRRRGGQPAEGEQQRAAAGLPERHADDRARDRADRQRGDVEADQHPRPLRPAPLDQAGQQHVHHRDGGPGEDRAGEQQGRRRGRAEHQARRQRDDRGEQHPLLAEPPGERGGEAGDDAEADDRGRRQDGDRRAGQAEPGLQLGEDRRQAGDRAAQVEAERDHADDEQRPLQPDARRRARRSAARAVSGSRGANATRSPATRSGHTGRRSRPSGELSRPPPRSRTAARPRCRRPPRTTPAGCCRPAGSRRSRR